MPINLGNTIWITLAADSSTPAAQAGYAGVRISIPDNTALPQLGKIDTLTVGPITVFGYLRQNADTLEWLITPPVDPNIAALDAIPGTRGWRSPAARNTYASIGSALLGVGVSGPDLRTGFKQLYDAATNDYIAAVLAGVVAQPPGPLS